MEKRIDLTQFESKQQEFTGYLEHNDLPDNNWFIEKYPETCYEFQEHVKKAYGNGALTGGQGDYCCLVFDLGPDNKDAYVTLESEETEPGLVEYYLSIEESREEPTHNGRLITKRTLIAELKRMYKIEDELRYQADWDLSCEEMGHKVRCHTCQKEFKAGDKYVTAYVDSHCITIPDGRLFFCNEKCEKVSE